MPVDIVVSALTLVDIRQHLPDLEWTPAVTLGSVPELPGVYVWIAEASGAVVYVGAADGAEGLRGRLRTEWIAPGKDYDDLAWVAHARMVSRLNARPHWATCNTPAVREKEIEGLSIRLTGIVPIINGGGWRTDITEHYPLAGPAEPGAR